ncbi:hypothetical protein BC826DRAFT_974772 [Russula brevipes]|nr:hypothetical protein BC826DRAFT_974772 [Russula brevipes]
MIKGDLYFRESALLGGEKNNLPLASSDSRAGCRLINLNPTRLPANPHGMPNLGLPGAPAEEVDKGGGARVTADGAHPTHGGSEAPEGPRGMERTPSSTAVDPEARTMHGQNQGQDQLARTREECNRAMVTESEANMPPRR